MFTARGLSILPKCGRRAISSSSSVFNIPPSPRPIPASSSQEGNEVDVDPIPSTPTWSVHALLESYPRPRISHEQLVKLHKLSALLPPSEGSEEARRMKEELEEMVRLVEAVRLVDTRGLDTEGRGEDQDGGEFERGKMTTSIPDGRIWQEGRGMELSTNTREVEFDDPEIESGKTLLKHAKVTKDGFYVVEADRRKKK